MFRSSSNFDRLLEKSTSQLLLEPDWAAIMMLCDCIRQGDTAPKYAVSAIKKKFYNQNPHVALYGLQVMESCVKNCGALIHDEIATKQFMEELREVVKTSNDEKIKTKVLEMIQTWGMAFRNSQKYRIVTDTLNLMKAEGWQFPPVRESEAMFEADTAPDWADGDVCHRCRVQFGMVTRQHHCRACGQVFCGKCSAKACTLPKFGIEREVRVCDSCYDKYGPADSAQASPVKSKRSDRPEGDLPAEYLASPLSRQSQAPPTKSGKTEEEIKEEEELQLAIALSKSEAEEKEKQKLRGTSQILANAAKNTASSNNEPSGSAKQEKTDDLDPELMRYLDRDYWEKKEKEKEQQKKVVVTSSPPSKAVTLSEAPRSAVASTVQAAPMVTSGANPIMDNNDEELDEFVTTLKTQVEIFVNRMKSNSSRGRSIANDSSVQTLFMNTMAMHSQLLKFIQQQEDKRVFYEGLQDKITQVKDARAALDALREEERERKRREAEEAERQRQIQMQAKLELMRKKKQEYLQYQRQLALQRMQEQEREMKLRQEQVKQQYMTGMPGMMGAPMQQAPMYQAYMQPGYAPPPHYDQVMGAPMQYSTGGPPQMTALPPMGAQQYAPSQSGDPYSMQGMAAALPQQQHMMAATSQPPSNPFPQQQPPQSMAPGPQPAMAAPPAHSMPPSMAHPPPVAPPPQGMAPPPSEHHQEEASLISFD